MIVIIMFAGCVHVHVGGQEEQTFQWRSVWRMGLVSREEKKEISP